MLLQLLVTVALKNLFQSWSSSRSELCKLGFNSITSDWRKMGYKALVLARRKCRAFVGRSHRRLTDPSASAF